MLTMFINKWADLMKAIVNFTVIIIIKLVSFSSAIGFFYSLQGLLERH